MSKIEGSGLGTLGEEDSAGFEATDGLAGEVAANFAGWEGWKVWPKNNRGLGTSEIGAGRVGVGLGAFGRTGDLERGSGTETGASDLGSRRGISNGDRKGKLERGIMGSGDTSSDSE